MHTASTDKITAHVKDLNVHPLISPIGAEQMWNVWLFWNGHRKRRGVAGRCKLCNATCQCIQFFYLWDKIWTPQHALSQAIWSWLESEGCHLTPLPVSSLFFCLVLLLCLDCHFFFWQSVLPASSQNIHQHFSLQVRLFWFLYCSC